MCQLVFRLWLCAPIAPPPHLPKSTHPPLYPLLGAFWAAALRGGSQSSSLEPLAVGVGGLTHLVPSPVPPMGQPPRPWALAPRQAPGSGFREGNPQPCGA